ncbi:MAG TPA: DPP IV N-terminal domain-containing protein [Vicinamibacterales bacterium]|jgi:dipeptidyl-peptidase-4|nr:DPP IV N-terminal domain-containing protein [Vicinamibacterales bacterium]
MKHLRLLLTTALAVAATAPAVNLRADGPPRDEPNYELASQWTIPKVNKLIFDVQVTPHWLEFSDRFWYAYETRGGKRYFLVDPAAAAPTGSKAAGRSVKAPLFDNAKMAALLASATRVPMDAQHLPIKSIKFVKKDTALLLEVQVPKDAEIPGLKKPVTTTTAQQAARDGDLDDPQQRRGGAAAADDEDEGGKKSIGFEYDLATGALALVPDFEPAKKPVWASVSPDEKIVVFARGHNLFMMDAAAFAKARKAPGDASAAETEITTDGEEHFSYARRLTDDDRKALKKDSKDDKNPKGPRVPSVTINWSRDSSHFAVVRRDERKVNDLWVINSLANPRPALESYRYAMPGEDNVPLPQIEVFDVASKGRVKVKADRFKDEALQIETAPVSAVGREKEHTEPQWVGNTADKLYFTRSSRDLHKVDLCVADTSTGETKVLVEERLNVYIETRPVRLIDNGREFVWWSERDGWAHLYLYDAAGTVKRQITSGEFVVDNVVSVDEKTRALLFTAVGREPNEDPYYAHLYRVGLDGGSPKLLDAGDFSHTVSGSDSGRYFVDTSSRVNTAPKSVLIDANGTPLGDLETTDLSAAVEAGFKFPEPFTVKADDGITDLYGVMYKPFDFDPGKKYPIIAYVYPGPQTESVAKTFTKNAADVQNMALAQFGFIVIEVGNRGGNPNRSKWYHTFGYGNLRDYGLADKKSAIEQLAKRHSFIDIDRVGIWGHSGGGFMSTAAMLVYPDFFKVGFSESGNHENNVYNNTWSEKHHGIKEIDEPDGDVKFEYDIAKNSELARNLKGHLMLTTGDIDDNVHMANTLRMANALIKAHKRFDFFILPGVRHSYQPVQDYMFWLRSDYFCRWLLGKAPDGADFVEMNREAEQTGPKKSGR